MNDLLGYLRCTVPLLGEALLSDRQLLESFVSQRDQAAFEVLLRRHGPMVLGVCRRVLRNLADADDVFQATFLVLVRKAASIQRRELLGNWLYGVAYRAAQEANAVRAARQRREQLMTLLPDRAAPEPGPDRELRQILDEELHQLPEKYRGALILCDLQGRTRRETARELRIPEGTLSSRLATGRKMLARRLTARGVTLSVAALLGTLADLAGAASVPSELKASTLQLALNAGLSGTSVPASLAPLVDGVLRTMLIHKVKTIGSLVLMAGLLAGSMSAVAYSGSGKGQGAARTPEGASKASVGAKSAQSKPTTAPPGVREKTTPFPAGDLAESLRAPVEFRGMDDPGTSLAEVTHILGEVYGLRLTINDAAFREVDVPEPWEMKIAEKRPLPPMTNAPLGSVLRVILDAATRQSTIPITALIRGDTIEILPERIAAREIMGRDDVPLPPLLNREFEGKPLREALREIAERNQGRLSIVVDGRVGELGDTPVTARFANTPVDTAVLLLTDSAKLAVVLLDNVYYVTTPENAERLKATHEKLRSSRGNLNPLG